MLVLKQIRIRPHQPGPMNDPPAGKPPCSSQSQSKRRREDSSRDGFIPEKRKRIDPPKVGTVLSNYVMCSGGLLVLSIICLH